MKLEGKEKENMKSTIVRPLFSNPNPKSHIRSIIEMELGFPIQPIYVWLSIGFYLPVNVE